MKGWFIGGEEQASAGVHVDYNWNKFEDYKGLVDELRFWNLAKPEQELKKDWEKAVGKGDKGLVGYYSFENINTPSRFLIQGKIEADEQIMSLHKFGRENFAAENAPVK